MTRKQAYEVLDALSESRRPRFSTGLKIEYAIKVMNVRIADSEKNNLAWSGNSSADAALVMLDRLDVDPEDDARVDSISSVIRSLVLEIEALKVKAER